MTPEQVALVRTSYAAALDDPMLLARTFYDRLFATTPHVRSLFPEDLADQQRRLLDELGRIVAALSDLGLLLARTQPLGARHATYGVRSSHYKPVGLALRHALGEVLGTGYPPEVDAAWAAAYQLIAETMEQGARSQATAHPTTG
jgi:nitric oxide dioxygenase